MIEITPEVLKRYRLSYAIPTWLSRMAKNWIESVLDNKRDELGKNRNTVMTIRVHNPFDIPWMKDRDVKHNQAQIYIYAPGNYVTVGFSYGYEVDGVSFKSPKYFVTSHDSCWREGLETILREMFSENPDLYLHNTLNFRINEDAELVREITNREQNRYPKAQFSNDAETLYELLHPGTEK